MPDAPQRFDWIDGAIMAGVGVIVFVLLVFSGCGGGLRVEFPPKQQVAGIEAVERIEAVAATVAKAADAAKTPAPGDWKSQAVWAGAAMLTAYPFGRLVRTKLLNPPTIKE